ncbi:helix-turn-helix domain-containing protein [Paraburkholderia agricolaris]|uniref:Helix-turn-helix domain-containing protein n=1 Tax=Paraburkholderia agricolaris TaxID=2152888 RepID=A0ABW8ZI45_9BURK
MNGRGFITSSMNELERVKIIEAVAQRRLTVVLAAERLQLCERQVSRLVRRYEAAGPTALVSARCRQSSNRERPAAIPHPGQMRRKQRRAVTAAERYSRLALATVHVRFIYCG